MNKKYYDHFCACGCNNKIKVNSYHKYYGIPKYCIGHGTRVKREVRICLNPKCKRVFECGITDKRKYCSFRCSTKNRKVIPIETQACVCDCGKTFGCKINSTRRFIHGHTNKNKKLSKSHKDNIKKSLSVSNHTRKGKKYIHRFNCQCLCCKSKRGEPHKLDCQCTSCKAKRGEYKGKNAPNWRGGTGNLPYMFRFNEEFKTLIRERDNHTCQLCGRTKEEEGRNLCVHHIYYDRMNDCSSKDDFITLCNSCNGKVNSNRKYWTEFLRKYT